MRRHSRRCNFFANAMKCRAAQSLPTQTTTLIDSVSHSSIPILNKAARTLCAPRPKANWRGAAFKVHNQTFKHQ